MADEQKQGGSIYGDRVEETIETEDKDVFDDVFGEDEEKKESRKKLKEKAEELKKSKDKKAAEQVQASAVANSEEKKSDDEDDDGDEVEEDKESASTEPVIFGEAEDKDTTDFETKEEAFENVDAGGKRKKSTSNFDDIVKENMEKSISKETNGKSPVGKGMGGKLDLKTVRFEEEEEEEEDKTPAHPIEKNIIKSVIKNKAMMAAQSEVKLNKGIKVTDDTIGKKKKNEEGEEEHDDLADALLREDGTIEEGIEDEVDFEEEEKSGTNSTDGKKPIMPKAKAVEEEETETDDSPNKIEKELEFLMSKEGHAFIGRKKSVLGKYGEEAGLFVGKVYEKDKEGTEILLDGLNPHVVFVCGARGSGKSYVLGVIAEELAIKNKNVGIVVVDPIGVFWSMKHPNKEEKELEKLAKWGLMPRGLDNIKVFIPVGMKDSVPKSTYDAVFSVQPALLTAEDWCLTFGIDRFSPTGLLMEKGIAKVKSGYTTIEGKEVRGKQTTFSLEDMINCFGEDAELNARDTGYKTDSIRALVSRFDAAKNWKIFDEKGTSLGLLSRKGQMTILDTSFLEDNVSALVIGIIARRLLSARKMGTRREAAGKFDEQPDVLEVTELNIPPTWLFIDEAHTLIPGGNQKTPASSALVEYVKQGRRPGCSLVFATQQPSAIDSKVLSQLDIMLTHKLVFDDDIRSIAKRIPGDHPKQYIRPSFIKTLPVGIALTGDGSETTSRAFIMAIRPRMSQHEGRDAETTEVKQELEENQVEILAVNIALRQLEKDPSISIDTIKETLDTLNNTYKKHIELAVILDLLKKKGITITEDRLYAKGVKEEIDAEATQELAEEAAKGKEGAEGEKEETYGEKLLKARKKLSQEEDMLGVEERVELTALQPAIDEAKARKILASNIAKKFIFLDQEILDRLVMKYALIYRVKYKYYSHKEAFHAGEAYINSLTGEFIHDDKGQLRESKGLPILLELNESETTVLKLVAERKRTAKDIAAFMKMEEGNAKRILDTLVKKNLLVQLDNNGKIIYTTSPKMEMDLPPNPLHNLLTSIGQRPILEVETAALVSPNLTEKEIPELLKKLWGNIITKEITHLFLPVWEGVLKKKTGEERIIAIDAINGKRIAE